MKRLLLLAFFGPLLLAAPRAVGQTMAVPASGNYVVQVGDTLESISARFLGAADRWRELLTANPGITNLNFITPGSEIRIAIVAAKRATIEQVFRQVEQMPFPRPWAQASVGGVLQERDGVRTFEKSSSQLRFDNETRMIVSEESVVFLRGATRAPENVSRKAIEIRAGQADLDVRRGANGTGNDIEFHIGGTMGTTKPGTTGRGAARARRTTDGGSRIMIYAGDGEVTAAGQPFSIATGMGIAVSPEGRTKGPEKLMAAPKPLAPNESQVFDFSNPTFTWEPVAGAVSYTLEVCRDPDCGQLVDRATSLRLTRWTPRLLPIGGLYWRVSAVSESGLDSFISEAQKFTIRTYWRRPVAGS